MTLINHMLPNGLHALVLLSFAVAVQANVADGDLLREVEDQPRQVVEVLLVGNEEPMRQLHVRDRLGRRSERCVRAEKARRRCQTRSSKRDSSVNGRLDRLIVGIFRNRKRRSSRAGRGRTSSFVVIGVGCKGLVGGVNGCVRIVRRDEVDRRRLDERSRRGLVFGLSR